MWFTEPKTIINTFKITKMHLPSIKLNWKREENAPDVDTTSIPVGSTSLGGGETHSEAF